MPAKLRFIGIEIGGTKLQLVAGDAAGRILDRRRIGVDQSAGGQGIRRQIQLALPGLLERWRPAGIAVGFGGPVDVRSGLTRCSHQIKGWNRFPLRSWLERVSGLPAAVENDANTAALGEAVRGAGVRRNPVCYVTLGSGVGGGLVVDGEIYHGATPGEAEIGHLRLDSKGVILEDRCSGWAVDRKIARHIAAHPRCRLARLSKGTRGGEARLLPGALKAGDRQARQILAETATDLAFGLSHVVHLFHPEVIVLGGGLSLLGNPLREAVAGFLPRFTMSAFLPPPRVLLARLGEDAVPVGALLLAGRLVGARI